MAGIANMLMQPLKLLENQYIAGGLKLFLVLYAAMIAPKLPIFMEDALRNSLVKMLLLFLIIYTGSKDPMLSLLIAVGFVLSMQVLRQAETVDTVAQLLNLSIDVPQKLLKDVIDGAQRIGKKGASRIGGPVEDVVDLAGEAIDTVQDIADAAIDKVQDIIS